MLLNHVPCDLLNSPDHSLDQENSVTFADEVLALVIGHNKIYYSNLQSFSTLTIACDVCANICGKHTIAIVKLTMDSLLTLS